MDSDSNVYTVLLAVSALGLISAIIYVWLKFGAAFGTYNPFAGLGA